MSILKSGKYFSEIFFESCVCTIMQKMKVKIIKVKNLIKKQFEPLNRKYSQKHQTLTFHSQYLHSFVILILHYQ